MKKSSKFFKFLSIFSVFAMVLTVGLSPTVAKASSTQNFNGDITVYTEMLEYGEWVRRLSAIPQAVQRIVTYNTGYFDQVPEYRDSNMRFVFDFDSNVSIADTNKKLSFIFYSKARLPQDKGDGEYFFNIYNVNNVYARVTTSDGTVKTVPVGYSSFVYVSGTCRLDVDILYSGSFNDCEIVVEFNYYNAYNFERLVNLGEVLVTDISFYMGAQNVWTLDNTRVPITDLPSADVDGLQDFSSFSPSGVLQDFLNVVFGYRFVSIAMLMLVSLGVLAFLLFGERK